MCFHTKNPKAVLGKVFEFSAGKTIPVNKMNYIQDDEIKSFNNLKNLCYRSSSTREISLVFKH